LPDREARKEILNVHLKSVKIQLGDDLDIEKIAELTEGFTGADIKEIVESAARGWFYDHINTFTADPNGDPENLEMRYFIQAVEELKSNLRARR
jgi:transitional endoplasmic reticulum ATPase